MRARIASLFIIMLLAMAACVLPGKTPGTPSTEASPASQTATPTLASPLAMLVLPADMEHEQYNLYQTTIYNLAQGSAYRFQVRNTLSAADVQSEPGLAIVIAFPPDPGLASLAAAAPNIQFLGIGLTGMTAGANLSLIGASGKPVDQQAFIAGYMAAMLALDYRVGIITQQDTPGGSTALQAFTNGMQFYCGLCNQAFPPWYDYPIHPQIPVDAPLSHYPAYADALLNYQVEVAYVYPEVANAELLDYMAQYGLKIISESMPFDDLQPNWIASIKPDWIPAIQAIWPDLIAGNGGQNIPTPLFLADVNPDLLTEGKQRLVEELLADMMAGFIQTGVNP